MIGGDENPFRVPIRYEDKKFLAPNEKLMIQAPIGEIHFPSPSVVYSKVTTRSRRNDEIKYATGKTVSEFYTSRDFPTKVLQTGIDKEHTPFYSNLAVNGMLSYLPSPFGLTLIEDNIAVSQGYSVIKNDMHGKPKSTFTYAHGQVSPLSGVEYLYRTNNDGTLNNHFDVIDSDGSIREKLMSVDYESYIDMRERKTNKQGVGLEVDVHIQYLPPAAVPQVFPSLTRETTSFKSSVLQKVFYQYGLMDSVKSIRQFI